MEGRCWCPGRAGGRWGHHEPRSRAVHVVQAHLGETFWDIQPFLVFNRELCFASALFPTFSLSPTTVALKLPPQSPRKERMRIKRNNYPFWPSQDLWTVFFVWCLKVVFPLFAEFMWTRWNEKPYGWDVLGGRSDLYRLCSWYGPRLHSGDSILNPIIIFIFLSALFQNGKNTVCWNWFLSYNSISINKWTNQQMKRFKSPAIMQSYVNKSML